MRYRTAIAFGCAAWLAAGSAAAQSALYRGPHPIDLDGHWHFEDGEHIHDGLAVGRGPFAAVDDVLLFLGDPIAYGYDGEVWTYDNAHPLPGGVSGYCGLSRPHRHAFAPDGRFRRQASGAYHYEGGMRGGFAMVEPRQLAPRRPVIAAPPPTSTAPFLFAGCMHSFAPGPRGGYLVSLLPGCTPTLGRPARAAPSRAAAPPRTYVDGNYGGVRRSPDARVGRRGSRRGQR